MMNLKQSNNLVRGAKVMHLISSGGMLICGILMILFQEKAIIGLARCIMVGTLSIFTGATGLFGYFSNDQYRLAFQSDFAIGIFNVVFGILLLIAKEKMLELLPCAVGIIALLDGGNKSQNAVEGGRFGMHKWYFVLASAVCELAVGIGVLICACYAFETRIWIGAAMVLVGAVNFWTTMYMVRIRDNNIAENK